MRTLSIRPSRAADRQTDGRTDREERSGRTDNLLKRGFQPTQRTQRKEREERNKITSLLDRPITATTTTAYAAGTMPSCGKHARNY